MRATMEYQLTPRQNFIEMMKGGKPERFVKQFEAFGILFTAAYRDRNFPKRGEVDKVSNWGVTVSWAADQPGAFPVHTPQTIVCKNIEEWREYVIAPSLKLSEAEWEKDIEAMERIDRSSQWVMPFVAPGIFEHCHYLAEIQNTLMAFYECPDKLKELIKYITEWELELAEVTCDHLHPDGLFHHDDWGTHISTFISPEMFAEFFLDAYKEVYGYWRSRGVELVVHHSDTYAETLVPYMVEMGVDVWQGAVTTNDIARIIRDYGDKITVMGGINSASVDYEGWSKEVIESEVRRACDAYGPYHFVPGLSQGLGVSTYPGVYDCAQECIEAYSKEYWAKHGM